MNSDVWAVVELMGHVRIAGRLSEEERFGGKMGRIDVPNPPNPTCIACKGTGVIAEQTIERPEGDEKLAAHPCGMETCVSGYVTQYFGASSVYRVTIVSEEAARAACRAGRVYSPGALALPQPANDFYEDRDDDY